MRKASRKEVLDSTIWVFERGPCSEPLAFSCTCTGDVVSTARKAEEMLGLAIFLGLQQVGQPKTVAPAPDMHHFYSNFMPSLIFSNFSFTNVFNWS